MSLWQWRLPCQAIFDFAVNEAGDQTKQNKNFQKNRCQCIISNVKIQLSCHICQPCGISLPLQQEGQWEKQDAVNICLQINTFTQQLYCLSHWLAAFVFLFFLFSTVLQEDAPYFLLRFKVKHNIIWHYNKNEKLHNAVCTRMAAGCYNSGE